MGYSPWGRKESDMSERLHWFGSPVGSGVATKCQALCGYWGHHGARHRLCSQDFVGEWVGQIGRFYQGKEQKAGGAQGTDMVLIQSCWGWKPVRRVFQAIQNLQYSRHFFHFSDIDTEAQKGHTTIH